MKYTSVILLKNYQKSFVLRKLQVYSAEHTVKNDTYVQIYECILQEIEQKSLFTSGFTCVFCWKFAKKWHIHRHLPRYFLKNTCKTEVKPHSNLIQIMNILIKKNNIKCMNCCSSNCWKFPKIEHLGGVLVRLYELDPPPYTRPPPRSSKSTFSDVIWLAILKII